MRASRITASVATHLPPDAVARDEARSSPLTRREPGGVAVEAAVVSLSRLSETDRVGWRELLAYRPESAPFVDEDWVAAWSEAFRPREPLLVCGWEGGRLVGLGALQNLTESWAGRRAAVLQSLTNVESPRFEFLSSRCRIDVQEQLWRALCETRRWDVIRLDHLPEDSPTLSAGMKVAEAFGWRRVVELTFESPWRLFPPPGGPWDDGLTRKFKANLRNRDRRLRALGEVTFKLAKDAVEQQAA